MKKKCLKCKELKPLNDFYPSKTSTDKRVSSCKDCEKLYNRERKRKIKEENNQIIAF